MQKNISTLIGIIIILIAAVVLVGGALGIQYYLKSQTPMTNVQSNPNAQIQNTETAGWKTYTNTEYGFEFKYPQGKTVFVCDSRIVNPDIYTSDRVCISFDNGRFNEQPIVQIWVYEPFYNDLQKEVNRSLTGIKFSQKDIIIDDTKALELSDKCGGGACSIDWMTIKNGLVYNITGVYYPGDNPENILSIYKQILSTFKFIKEDIVYNNTQYGFQITLPDLWKDYKINDRWRWDGLIVDGPPPEGPAYDGPIVLIENPELTANNRFAGIPIMVIQPTVWDLIKTGKVSVSAAPIGPQKIGQNDKFVFATPPRYIGFADDLNSEQINEVYEIVKTFEAF